jgi:hypothetical protein
MKERVLVSRVLFFVVTTPPMGFLKNKIIGFREGKFFVTGDQYDHKKVQRPLKETTENLCFRSLEET